MPMLSLIAGFAATAVLALTPFSGLADTHSAETHCVLTVVDQKPTGELVMHESHCFNSFSEAMEFASGGEIDLPRSAQGSDVFIDGSVAAYAASTFTIGIHYDGYAGSGSSISIAGDSCVGGWWNTSAAWDNRISSSYNGCAVLRYYNDPDKSQYLGYTSGVGTTDNLASGANNKAESVSYSSS